MGYFFMKCRYLKDLKIIFKIDILVFGGNVFNTFFGWLSEILRDSLLWVLVITVVCLVLYEKLLGYLPVLSLGQIRFRTKNMAICNIFQFKI